MLFSDQSHKCYTRKYVGAMIFYSDGIYYILRLYAIKLKEIIIDSITKPNRILMILINLKRSSYFILYDDKNPTYSILVIWYDKKISDE